ncbi:MAG: hypothetical protein E7069_06320 [Bacteroidales bacterium]|jgi:hypothetical protein|nr:hypothetical protein [Bacteroidales bacterium]
MKAKTQYNDFEGTIAAKVISDGRDTDSFDSLLLSKFNNFDDSRYKCIGMKFSLGRQNTDIIAEFICRDLSSNQYVKFLTQEYFDLTELFDFWAYANIVIGKDMDKVDENQIIDAHIKLSHV